MGKAGRKRKPGKRTPSGQLSRAGKLYDKGTERAEWKQSVYGADGSDALGRAYVMGLLGEHGQTLLATGRAIARAYWPIFGTGRIGCTLGGVTGGGGEGSKAQEEWLTAQLRIVDAMGIEYRRAFDALVIDVNPDEGPVWLDRLIAKQFKQADSENLHRAIYALHKLAA